MADIQSKILSKYGIDIAQDNIFKLYKIENADISSDDLAKKIEETRKRWNTSINGANEKNAERDRARLEKADKYEAILKDAKLRKEVFAYYNKPAGNTGGDAATPGGGSTEFAKEYFELVATTKKIKKADVDFFFKYYQSERKNKKAIIEMLTKDMKVSGLGKEDKIATEADAEEEGKKKNEDSLLIVNLFQEATILGIRRAVEKYEEAIQSAEICQRYPKLREGLYAFLEIEDVSNAKQFAEVMSAKGKEVYAVRQEKGAEYVPLVDLFNKLQSLSDNQDVVDNISEFKLLLKYPNLTPYMFAFVEMKPSTLKGIVKVANKDYSFRDDTDFILNYYKPIHDNFNISDSGISALLRKAEKKAKQNKVLNEIDKKLGRDKNKKKTAIVPEIIHWLVYWPIFLIYFVFEVAKAIFTELHRFAIPAFVITLCLSNWLMPKITGIGNMLDLRKIFFKSQWLSFLDELFEANMANGFEIVLLSLVAIILILAVNALPAIFVFFFIAEFADDFNKRFDWTGLERTFKQVFDILKAKTSAEYDAQKQLFVKKKIPKILINLVCLGIVVALIIFAPTGLKIFSEKTGYGQKIEISEEESDPGIDEPLTDMSDDIEEISLSSGKEMEIIESEANIRSGPGKDYDVITTAKKGEIYIATGNEEKASNGRTWYEIYIDEDMTQTGWASQKVIDFK